MKVKMTLTVLLAALILTAAAAGCAGTENMPGEGTGATGTQAVPAASQNGLTDTAASTAPAGSAGTSGSATSAGSAGTSGSAAPAGNVGETYIFTDSAGREVELPSNIDRVAPSGPLAQIVLITLCPDKLVGLASVIEENQFEYIDKKYEALPVFGNFYADTLNLESVMMAAPQLIIDIGESKPHIDDDMNGIQERTGIPTVFIHMEMDTMLEAYETLGRLTGEAEQADRIISYITETFEKTVQKAGAIPEADRVRVYYGQEDGLTAFVSGTVHSDVIGFAGGFNVAEVEESVRGGASMISMEQLMLWNPDVLLFVPGSIYDEVGARVEWSGIGAVKTGRFYEVPVGPYNWMGRPPSVNRILGIKWLANLLYPDIFRFDMYEETREFFRIFYHCGVTDAQIEALLANSTLK